MKIFEKIFTIIKILTTGILLLLFITFKVIPNITVNKQDDISNVTHETISDFKQSSTIKKSTDNHTESTKQFDESTLESVKMPEIGNYSEDETSDHVSTTTESEPEEDKKLITKDKIESSEKIAYIFIPANNNYSKLDWVANKMNLPNYVDTAPKSDFKKVFVSVSYGTQGDQRIVSDQLYKTITTLKSNGFNRFILCFASMSGYAAEYFINNYNETDLNVTDIILISAVNGNGFNSPKTVSAHYVTSTNDHTVDTNWAMASINSGWKSTDQFLGTEDHNHILQSQATYNAFAAIT